MMATGKEQLQYILVKTKVGENTEYYVRALEMIIAQELRERLFPGSIELRTIELERESSK